MRLSLSLFVLLFLLSCSGTKELKSGTSKKDYFEGIVTYKTSSVKPDGIPEEDWNNKIKEIFGEQRYMLQKNYYRPNQFASEINTGLELGKQVYNPKDSLHYAWMLNADVAQTEDKRVPTFVTIKEFIDLDTTATINNIKCQAVKVKFSMGHAIVWYNSDVLKCNGSQYVGALFEKEIIEKINCLPIKAEVAGMLLIEMDTFQEGPVSDDVFLIPEFREIAEPFSF